MRIAGLFTVCGVYVLLVGCPTSPPLPPSGSVALTQVANGLTSPVTLVQPPDDTGRLFIVDQVGVIRVLLSDGSLAAAPFLDVRDRMIVPNAIYDERGLLGLAFHPQYATNRRFFVMYNAPGSNLPAGFNSEVRISEFLASAADPNLADATTERILLAVAKPQPNHNGGTVAFGPDNLLYISIGDGGGGNDVGNGHTPGIGNAQDLSKLLGKILRIDVDGGPPYGVPADNPFVSTAGAAPEVWAYGFRNPYRFSFDPGGDHRLFAGDDGEQLFEEVDIVTRGGNYGWHIREGDHCFDPANPTNPPDSCSTTGANGEPLIEPIISYPHFVNGQPAARAVIGGYIYRGTAIPSFAGVYVFGDFTTSALVPSGHLLIGVETSDGTWTSNALMIAGTPDGQLGQFVRGFGQDASGEVYLLTSRQSGVTGTTGAVYRLAPAP